MDKFIARANIENFKKQLDAEKDQAKRKVSLQLLAEEEMRLAAALRGKQKEGRRLGPPLAPVRREHLDRVTCSRVYPAVKDAAARKYESMRPFLIDDGYFQVAVKRRG